MLSLEGIEVKQGKISRRFSDSIGIGAGATIEHEIRPGVGLGALTLGIDREAVRALLGEPTHVATQDCGLGELDHVWDFETQGVSLLFSEDVGYRLDSITTSFPGASLGGSYIVGLSEEELLAGDFDGLGPPSLDEDFEESGRDYGWESLNLSCWVTGGLVVSVTVMPRYDETGEVPLWPDAGRA